MCQKYSSKDTSINVINKIYRQYDFPANSKIFDYGGGKHDKNIEFMKEKNGSNIFVYDKFNRSDEYNNETLKYFKENEPDFVVCSNVLNVIMEDNIILDICKDISDYSVKNTTILFTIYECDKTGVGKITSKGYQRNQKAKEYLTFIETYFKVIYCKSGIIKCIKKED